MQQGPTLEEQRAEFLLARGVPPEFANAIESWALRGRFAAKAQKPTFRKALVSLAILLGVTGVVIVVIRQLSQIPEQQARDAASLVSGVLMVWNVGFGPAILLPVGLLVIALGYMILEDPYDGRCRAARGLWSAMGLPGFYTKPLIAVVRPNAENADEFLILFRRLDLRIRQLIVGALAFAGTVASVAVTVIEANSFLVAGSNGVLQQIFAGEVTRKVYQLGDARVVETDCYETSGRSKEWRVLFKLQMKDGEAFDFGNAVPVTGSRLDALEVIAAALPTGTHYAPAPELGNRIQRCIAETFRDEPDAVRRVVMLMKPIPMQVAPAR